MELVLGLSSVYGFNRKKLDAGKGMFKVLLILKYNEISSA
jgi:hypothetical protein